ncbi:hypothetical protein MMC11_008210 [Xylographa trunciseda]|nr:hypothetical protein [Xylographa trunciseda]
MPSSFRLQKLDDHLSTFWNTSNDFDNMIFPADISSVQYGETSLALTTSPANPSVSAVPELSLNELINPFPGNVNHGLALEPRSSSTTSEVTELGVQKPNRPRPYVCTASICALLPGFTIKGDLTRHQLEVHENGGSKAIFCPHRECKRSTGTPFKRKENLKDHVRRLHNGVAATLLSSGMQATLDLRSAAIDDNAEVEKQSAVIRSSSPLTFPPSQHLERKEPSETLPSSMKRRKRQHEPESPLSDGAPNTLGDEVDEELEAQVKRLKQLVERKDMELETIVSERDRLRKTEVEKNAQIYLLKDMVQSLCSGRLSGS